MSLSFIIGILTVNLSVGTRSSCVQQNHCTSWMRSQAQLRNDKIIIYEAIHQLYTLNSFPVMAIELSIAQWLEHSVCNRGVANWSPIIGILTENFSTGTRSSYVL